MRFLFLLCEWHAALSVSLLILQIGAKLCDCLRNLLFLVGAMVRTAATPSEVGNNLRSIVKWSTTEGGSIVFQCVVILFFEFIYRTYLVGFIYLFWNYMCVCVLLVLFLPAWILN